MDVYFVRHGETAGNRSFSHQPADTPLTPLGEAQARATGARLREFTPTRIISSPLTRAHSTAKIIGEELSLPVTTHQSLVELKRPSYVHGRKHYSLRSLWYILKWFFQYKNPAWRTVGSESYNAFLERIEEAKEYLEHFAEDEREERIVVVSHSIFINFFLEHACYGRRMNILQAFLRLTKILALDNSSITHLHYSPAENPEDCTWKLLAYDDDAHVLRALQEQPT